MEGKLKCIVKRTDELYGHVTNISASLENLQKTIGGYIEPVCIRQIEKDGKTVYLVILCDEEGKLKYKKRNLNIGTDVLCGDLVIIGADGEDFCDVPISFEEWRKTVREFIWRYGA